MGLMPLGSSRAARVTGTGIRPNDLLTETL
jgi:hypothetical protein